MIYHVLPNTFSHLNQLQAKVLKELVIVFKYNNCHNYIYNYKYNRGKILRLKYKIFIYLYKFIFNRFLEILNYRLDDQFVI